MARCLLRFAIMSGLPIVGHCRWSGSEALSGAKLNGTLVLSHSLINTSSTLQCGEWTGNANVAS